MANEWQVESEYLESLARPAAPAAQVESEYVEALAVPDAPAGQGESVYTEVLYIWANLAQIGSLYTEFLVQMEPDTPPPATGHVYDHTGAQRQVYQLTDSGLIEVDFLTKV